MNWCHYDDLGKILMTGVALPTVTLGDFSHIGRVLIGIPDGVSWETHFVEGDKLKSREVMGVVVDGSVLRGIPLGATLTVDELSAHEIDDGEADLTFSSPGEYSLKISKWPYLDWSFVFEN